jgi:hypothetical protein
MDDAFITYRYGQNLAQGLGLVFNPGQYVQGSTSPGHMLLSSAVYALFGLHATPVAMAVIGCCAWNAQALALYRLLTPALGGAGAAVVALAIDLGVNGAAAWVPLETHLVAMLVLFAFVMLREQRFIGAAVCSGLAVFVRPDAAVAAALVLSAVLWELRARALVPLAWFAALALPWPLFATFYYGSPLPQTALTKFQRVGLFEYVFHELGHPSRRLLWAGAGIAWILIALAVALAGAVRLFKRDRRLLPYLTYGALHACAYAELRPFKLHTWHLYPWTSLFCVCVMSALLPLGLFVGSAALPRKAVHLLQVCLLTGLLLNAAVRFKAECVGLPKGYWSGQRDGAYQRVAEYLRQHANESDWFASIEVGTIAYYSGLSAYDLGGLVTRLDDPIGAHPVRFVVVNNSSMLRQTPSAQVFSAREGEFFANVYEPKKP